MIKHIILTVYKSIIQVLATTYIGFAYGDQMDRSPEEVLPEWLLKIARGSKKNE